MKFFREEFGHDYESYRFGYCEYADLEPSDDLAVLYAQGFLPYSADPAISGRFYRARSARLALDGFSLSSENRRVAKRFDDSFVRSVRPAAQADEDVKNLFLGYFAARHGKNVMGDARLAAILTCPLPLSLATYEKDGRLLAAALEVGDARFGHFWFSAYDLLLTHQSLGMWLMIDGARRAREAGRAYYYLGTVYGEKALYKANLAPLEYWNGRQWSSDLVALKTRARAETP